MDKEKSKCLVIDASVARAVGETEHPVSKSCRELLKGVLRICHKFVMTEDIKSEWNKHQSRFTRKWKVGMISRKKMVNPKQEKVDNKALRDKIEKSNCSEKKHGIMRKDVHLIEAALATDHIIVSLDNEAKEVFIEEDILKQVTWINPKELNTIEWLNSLQEK